jgi:hypothetical protein
MKQIIAAVVLMVVLMSGVAFGAATVFFKDGSKETGSSVWIEGNSVYLSKAKENYEFSADEVLMDETQKFNRIGKFSDVSVPDSNKSASTSPRVNDLVEQIMTGSNIDRQIDQLVEQFSSGALSSAGSNGEQLAQALAGFDGKKAKQKIRAYYRSHLDAKTLEAVLAWSKSPLGMKIRDVEAAKGVNSPEAAQQIVNGQDEDSLPPQRRALVKELDKSSRATEMALQMISDSMSGAMAAIPAKTAEQKLARKEIEKQAAAKKDEMIPVLRKTVLASLAYTYAELSDDELKGYVAFMNTDPARKFTKATMGALSEMAKAMSASMIKNIIKASEQQAGTQGR